MYLTFDLFVCPWKRHSLLFTFVLKKPCFSIFHINYLINISPYLRALANLGCQKENELKQLCICTSSSEFYYKIMKKPYIRTIIGSFGRECVLIVLHSFLQGWNSPAPFSEEPLSFLGTPSFRSKFKKLPHSF